MTALTTLKNLLTPFTNNTETDDEPSTDTFDLAASRDELAAKYDEVDHPDSNIPAIPRDELDLGIFPEDNAWGNRLTISSQDEHGQITNVNGHILVPRENQMFAGGGRQVKPGDLFGYEMESGRIAVSVLTAVKNSSDPKDLFFANCAPVGYLEGTITA